MVAVEFLAPPLPPYIVVTKSRHRSFVNPSDSLSPRAARAVDDARKRLAKAQKAQHAAEVALAEARGASQVGPGTRGARCQVRVHAWQCPEGASYPKRLHIKRRSSRPGVTAQKYTWPQASACTEGPETAAVRPPGRRPGCTSALSTPTRRGCWTSRSSRRLPAWTSHRSAPWPSSWRPDCCRFRPLGACACLRPWRRRFGAPPAGSSHGWRHNPPPPRGTAGPRAGIRWGPAGGKRGAIWPGVAEPTTLR